ncbi:hypothetical protein [Alicyclobacillus ferrooxydans]|uniref:Uncharacterized protein n=1 Tax=Alicyclobacillus ferrooxydans TaxID=471514 RepID=A0A0P9D3B5_9BACL|nr:hypothetical protein [Alicyclobacillus ferrooxydans]KPV44007.1 hypothetical protein AN477_09865 [Alicyclobacillus ferrooxydans]
MKTRVLKWYQIVGYAVDDSNMENPFTYLVESESPHNVLKLHGGRRRCETADGKSVLVQFPTREKDVKWMPNWTPTDVYLVGLSGAPGTAGASGSTGVTKVIPVTKYLCTCGREHFSEHPYRSVWCKCGQKAFPVPQPWEAQAAQHPPEGTHPDM